MQFQVPQFIETESKIIGPLTLKQFFYLAGAAAFGFATFFFLRTWLWLILVAFVAVVSLALAFGKWNGRTIPSILASAFHYFIRPKFYLWRREGQPTTAPMPPASQRLPAQQASLKTLGLKLTTSTGAIEKREKFNPFAFLKRTEEAAKEHVELLRKSTGEREEARRVDYR